MRHLTCQEVILERLLDYLDARLRPEALADFERHLDDCVACRVYLATYERTPQAIRCTGRVQMPSEMKVHLRRVLLQQFWNRHP